MAETKNYHQIAFETIDIPPMYLMDSFSTLMSKVKSMGVTGLNRVVIYKEGKPLVDRGQSDVMVYGQEIFITPANLYGEDGMRKTIRYSFRGNIIDDLCTPTCPQLIYDFGSND